MRFGPLLAFLPCVAACGGATQVVARPTLPAPLAARASVATEAVWMEPTRLRGEGLVAFPEEAAPLEDAIARALTDAGLDVVPLEERRAAISRMRAGHLPDRDARCAPMPPPARWLEARYEGARTVASSLDCRSTQPPWEEGPFTPGCILHVAVRRGATEVELETTRVFPLGVSREVVLASIEREGLELHAADPDDGGSALLLGMLGDAARPPVVVRDVDTMGAWDPTLASHLDDQLQGALAPHRDALLACDRGEPQFDHWGNDFQLEIARDGRIVRCEPQMADHNARSSFACECGVMSRALDFGAGLGIRRVRFGMQVDPATPRRTVSSTHYAGSSFRVRDATDRSVMLGDPAFGDALDACLAQGAEEISASRLLADLTVDAAGRVTNATVQSMADDVIDPALQTCALEALRATRFTCPFDGSADVRGEIDLFRVRYGGVEVEPEIAERVSAQGLALPRGRWHFDTPSRDAPWVLVTSSARLDASGASADGSSIEGEDVRVVAVGTLTMGEIAQWLRSYRAPRLRRVYFAVDSGDDLPTWSVLYISRASDTARDVLEVSGSRVVRRAQAGALSTSVAIESEDPDTLRRAIDPYRSEPLTLVIDGTTTLQQALRTIDASRSEDRRTVWSIGP